MEKKYLSCIIIVLVSLLAGSCVRMGAAYYGHGANSILKPPHSDSTRIAFVSEVGASYASAAGYQQDHAHHFEAFASAAQRFSFLNIAVRGSYFHGRYYLHDSSYNAGILQHLQTYEPLFYRGFNITGELSANIPVLGKHAIRPFIQRSLAFEEGSFRNMVQETTVLDSGLWNITRISRDFTPAFTNFGIEVSVRNKSSEIIHGGYFSFPERSIMTEMNTLFRIGSYVRYRHRFFSVHAKFDIGRSRGILGAGLSVSPDALIRGFR